MSNRGTVQPTATLGQLKDIVSALVEAIPSNLTKEEAQKVVGSKGKLGKGVRKLIYTLIGTLYQDILSEWDKFYSEVMGMTIDFSNLVIPTKPEGDWWLIIVAPGVTYNRIIAALRKLFPVWVYTNDLDKVIDMTKEQRRATDKPYAIWVRANVEADSDNKNKPANDLVNTNQITLKERLLLEGVYFKRTGRHLDVSNWTLCAGSRHLGGGVPDVSWSGGDDKLDVDWCYPDNCYSRLRSRSVSF